MSTQAQTRKALVAIDLGAESCRVSLLQWTDGTPKITLVHRFGNGPKTRGEELHWSLELIESGVDHGMRRAAELAPEGIAAVSVDGWAVDYVRLDEQGKPYDDPFCYRDTRTVAAEEKLHEKITPQRMREITAITPMRINTLYQQFADGTAGLPAAKGWLNLPEYLLFRYGGRPVSERTNAAHTQMVDATTRTWSEEIFQAAGLGPAPELVDPGTDLGKLAGPLAELPAFADTRLIAPACHDTASAIAGIPAVGDDWAYISSGTWSLVGTPVAKPITSPLAAADGFTNLAGTGGLTCFHVNVNGMWMLSQCMEQWRGFKDADSWQIEELVDAAERLPVPPALLDVDHPDLLLPGEMMGRINTQLTGRGHEPLEEHPGKAPAFASLIFHSLSARYGEVLAKIEAHTGKRLKRIFIVGGGSRNECLNRMIAQVTGLEVHRGSPESSTIGSFALQLAVLEGHPAPDAATVGKWAQELQSAPILTA